MIDPLHAEEIETQFTEAINELLRQLLELGFCDDCMSDMMMAGSLYRFLKIADEKGELTTAADHVRSLLGSIEAELTDKPLH